MPVPPILKNTASQLIPLSVFDSDGAIVKTPTIAAGDFVIYADFVSQGNLTVSEDPATSGLLKGEPSQGQTNGDILAIRAEDQAGDEWESYWVYIWTESQQIGDLSTEAKQDIIDTNVDAVLLDTGTDGVVVNDLTTAAKALIQTEANDALVAQKLDHLVAVAESDDPVDDSIMAKLAASDGDWSGFDEATDSLEAIRDRGDAAWITSTVVTVQSSAVAEDDWTFYTHDTISQAVTGLGNITGYAAVWVVVKDKHGKLDSEAILLVSSDVGLEVLNGAAHGTAADGSVTVDDAAAGDITIALAAAATDDLEPGKGLVWGIKWKDGSGNVYTLLDGDCDILTGPVRATS